MFYMKKSMTVEEAEEASEIIHQRTSVNVEPTLHYLSHVNLNICIPHDKVQKFLNFVFNFLDDEVYNNDAR